MSKEVKLTEILEYQIISLPGFFKFAKQLIEALEVFRNNHLGFAPLHPADIQVDLETLAILRLDLRQQADISATGPKDWLYIAPEQTGKLNREVDHRTDFYIMGLIFYRMLTGKNLFDAKGKSEWIHAHLAKSPIPAEKRQPHVPTGLSMLLGKLLSKSMEDRYQTVNGLQMDLSHCIQQYEQTSTVAAFTLAAAERGKAFHIPDSLYGREDEQALFKDVFQWTTLGSTQMICVYGPSGIGKTALIQEAIQKIVRSEAYSISGKFDLLQQDSPMSPLIHAFRELVMQLLKEDERSLARWRTSITHALGSNGAIIAEVIPEIERIIGESHSVELLPPEESMKRFQLTFCRFIQVFCSQKHPLVLFLDDLQWADADSWRMVRSIMTDPQCQSLLLIGAFRDQNTQHANPMFEELESIESSGVNIHLLPLTPLSPNEINRMVADTLRIHEQDAYAISKTLTPLTGGNPFLFRQLFQTSLLEQILRYDDIALKWIWTPDSIHRFDDFVDTDMLLSYMVTNINRLPEKSRQAIIEASCLGGEFEVRQLSALRQESLEQTLETLKPAIQQQMMLVIEEEKHTDLALKQQRIRFFHDRIQEAANGLLDKVASEFIHWQAGCYLLDHTDFSSMDPHLFEMAKHLNVGASHAITVEEKYRLFRINALAGKKAKYATAYEAALFYFQKATEQIDDNRWTQDFDFCFDISIDHLECEYVQNHFSASDDKLTALLQRARNSVERTRVHQLKITRLLQADKYQEGIAMGMKCLRDLGIRIPNKPGKATLFLEMIFTKKRLSRYIGKLSHLPPVSLPEKKAAMNVLILISAAAYLYDRELSFLLICKFVRLSLRYGNAPSSATAFVNFGAGLCLSSIDSKMGNSVMKEGLKLAETNNQPSVLSRVHLAYGAVSFMANDDKRDYNVSLKRSIEYGLEAGDYVFIGHAVSTHILNLYLSGKLKQIKTVIPEYREILGGTQNQYLHAYMDILSLWTDRLSGTIEKSIAYDQEVDLIQSIRHSGMEELLMFQYHCCQLQEGYLFGQYSIAIWNSEKAVDYKNNAIHLFQESEYYYYTGLTITAMWDTFSIAEKRNRQKILNICLHKLKFWVKACPEFMKHKALLLSAENAWIQGEYSVAALRYDEAIKEARLNSYTFHEAIAAECAGRYYLSQSRETIAKAYLTDAITKYEQCGAQGKVVAISKQYKNLYNELFSSFEDSNPIVLEKAVLTKNSDVREVFDISIIQEAFQSMADESDQHKLIDNLMRLLLENAGAQQGCLIMEKENRYYVEVAVGKDGIIIRERFSVEQYEGICLPAVQYSIHSTEPVLLEDAAMAGPYTKDPYVVTNQTKSMLCVPLPLHSRLSGVLYLENNLLSGAFALHQFDMLRMLATQTIFLLKLIPQDHGLKISNDGIKVSEDEKAPLDALTGRELEVLQLMSLGLSNHEIAKSLTIAVGTVKIHINRIFSKMNVTRRTKAVFEAKRLNLLTENSSINR